MAGVPPVEPFMVRMVAPLRLLPRGERLERFEEGLVECFPVA